MVSTDISSIKIQACVKYFSKVVHSQCKKMSWCENPVKFIFKLFFVLLILCSHNWLTIGPFIIFMCQKTPNVPINAHTTQFFNPVNPPKLVKW